MAKKKEDDAAPIEGAGIAAEAPATPRMDRRLIVDPGFIRQLLCGIGVFSPYLLCTAHPLPEDVRITGATFADGKIVLTVDSATFTEDTPQTLPNPTYRLVKDPTPEAFQRAYESAE